MEWELQFIILFTGIWCLIGAIFLAIGIGMNRSQRRREERLRDRADGVVLEMIRHTESRHDGTTATGWNPLVEFEYEGRRISLEGEPVSRKQYYEGQRVQVRYDPDDPSCFSIGSNGVLGLLGRIFTAVGVGCIVIGLAAAVVVHWSAARLIR